MSKYLKLFNEDAEYKAFKETEEYILPNVSYVKADNVVYYNPFTEAKLGVIMARYNATEENKLAIANTSNVKSLKVNGTEVEFGDTYYFSEVGEYDVEIELIDTTLIASETFAITCLTLINIPNSVTEIGNNAFVQCTSLTAINIPDSVTSIGEGAFANCTSLTSIVIPDSVTSIRIATFLTCSSLTSVHIGSGVTSIGEIAFVECTSLTSINIPDSVTTIGSNAFSSCTSLTSIVIPDSVITIGLGAFGECSGLTSIVIPDSVTEIGGGAFANCSGLTNVHIGSGVITIGKQAFTQCSGLSEITCNAITAPTIDSTTFQYIKYGGVLNVPEGSDYSSWMSTSNYYLGYYNWNMEYMIELPDDFEDSVIMTSESNPRVMEVCYNQGWAASPDQMLASEAYVVTNIGTAFAATADGSGNVTQPEMLEIKSFDEFQYFVNVKEIKEYAFNDCSNLTSIVIPDSVTSIGESAFNGCSGLTSVHIGSGVASIRRQAFMSCSSLTSVVIPDSVTSIEQYAFAYCYNLTSINIPDSVTSIGDGAFNSCESLPVEDNIYYADTYLVGAVDKSLSTYTIKEGTKWIGNEGFDGCSNLTSITIPDSVTTIGASAFSYCTSLKEITCNAITAPTIYYTTFRILKTYGILKVPTGSDYSTWMSRDNYYLGSHKWTVEYI